MSDQENPFAPIDTPATPTTPGEPLNLAPADLIKAQAIVKDANQFWLAIIMCILCTSIGSLIISPWYGVRLMQWSQLANRYPELLSLNAPAKSLQSDFRGAKTKLLVGVIFGVVMLCLGFTFFLVLLFVGSSMP